VNNERAESIANESAKIGDGSAYYPLFAHIADEHGLVLLESELHEIVRLARQCEPAPPDRLHDPAVLRGIIARNARHRLTADDPDAPMAITAQDIADGMTILYEVQGK
jgi:hypothetical protein